MKVVVGNQVFSGDNQPVMVILTNEDKDRIARMGDQAAYCVYPESVDSEEVAAWMRAALERAEGGEKTRPKTMEVPLSPGDKQSPMITNTMKQYCMGEYSWKEEAPYYDEDGEIHNGTVTHVVPWDLCKQIYKQMATMANGSPEMEPDRGDA